MDQYERLRLVIGDEKVNLLGTKKVLVFGLGGVGGHAVDALARSGIMDFTIVDNDKVNITNINRQLIANLDTIGKFKVDVMAKHLLSINKDIKVTKHAMFYLPSESAIFDFSKYDYVIDAIDTVSAKIDIIMKCKEAGTPIISALGCGNKLDPTKLEITDIYKTSYDPLAKVMRTELRKRKVKSLKVVCSTESPSKAKVMKDPETNKTIPGSTALVPSVAGIMMASEVIKEFIK